MQELVRNERIIPPDLLSRVESSKLPLDDIELDALHLSTRSYNALKKRGIDDIRKLVCLTDSDLAKIPNVGARSLQEIVRNTNEYLERITEPEEAERLFTVSLLELIRARAANVDSATPASLANQNLDKQFLEPIPLHEIVTNDDLLDWLVHLGLSSSLDIWVLAFGHHLRIAPVFGESLKEISGGVPGRWQAGRMIDVRTNVEAIRTSHSAETALNASSAIPDIQSSFDFLRVELVIKDSPSSEVYWEAFLPYQCLSQRIDWFSDDDKTTGLCAFLRQIAQNNVAHWANPPVADWERLSRRRAVDAFYYWLSFLGSRVSKRDQEIFRHRFGLVSGERSTLQEVGSECNITRERVRQIVSRCLKWLLHPARRRYLTPFISHFDVLFEEHGGIMTLDEIVNSCVFFKEFVGVSSLQAAELLLVGCNKYNALDHGPIKDTLSNMAARWVTWHIDEINPAAIKRARETAKHLVSISPLQYDSDELVDVVSSSSNIDKELVRASLRTCRELPNSRLGYSHLVNGEKYFTVYQMATVALRELLVPASRNVIHKKICEIFPDRNVDIRTLRNTLSSGQFRIIDRGIYALLGSNQSSNVRAWTKESRKKDRA